MGTRRMTAQDSRRHRGWYRFFLTMTVLTLLGAAFAIGILGGVFVAVSDILPRGRALADLQPSVPTRILASDGTVLARLFLPDQNREIIPLSQMGLMRDTTIAIEDVRFYSHPGIDMRGIARAMVKNIAAGNSKEGASTITQQLARGLYLTRRKALRRKLQEMILALELERRYAKDEILEAYLNQVFYGSNPYSLQSWGAEMAARNYFGKPTKELTLAEAALLSGLPKNPDGYNPYAHPEAAIARRNLVLKTMLDNDMISRTAYQTAYNTPLRLAKPKKIRDSRAAHAPYFVEFIKQEMQRIYGKDDATTMMYQHGVDIYTSLDPRMQKVAEDALNTGVEKNRSRNIGDGALISIDPQTGFIKAMVGGTSFTKDNYNIVTQGYRQPGSSFKPFVYTAALLRGYTPKTTVSDSRRSYPSGSGKPWSPRNSDGAYRGRMQLQQAVWLSRNAAAVSVAADVDIENVISVAHAMGISSHLEPVLPTAIGATAVTPLDMCTGYAVLANHGVLNAPTGIVKITTPDGQEVLYESTMKPTRVLPTAIADTMKEVMRGVIQRGTAARALGRFPYPASGKTGTTNSYRDAWFIGYTDNLATAVWVGNRDNTPMNRTFGGTVPAPVWGEFMRVAEPIMIAEHKDVATELTRRNNQPELLAKELNTSPSPHIAKLIGRRETANADTDTRPADNYTLTICEDSGRRATSYCPDTETRSYVKGEPPYPPAGKCTQHTKPEDVPNADGEPSRPGANDQQGGVLISVCVETGKIATDKCPIVKLRRFTENAPVETCPMHRNR